MSAQRGDVVNDFGHMFERLGASYNLGRMWALLLASDEPLSQDDIRTALGVSQSVVSSTLRQLEASSMVERVRAAGDRRIRYAAGTVGTLLAAKASEQRMRELTDLLDALRATDVPPAVAARLDAQVAFSRYMASGINGLIAAWEQGEGRT